MGFEETLRALQEQQDIADGKGPGSSSTGRYAYSPGDSANVARLKRNLKAQAEKREQAKRAKDEADLPAKKLREVNKRIRDDVSGNNAPQSAEDFIAGDMGNADGALAETRGAATSTRAAVQGMKAAEQGEDFKFSPDSIYMSASTTASENFMYGVGTLLGSYGDIAQMVGGWTGLSDYSKGNWLSQGLQGVGNDLKSEHETYIPPELQDPDLSFATFFNPSFWLIHGAQFAPQLVEIAATMAFSAGTASVVKVGAQRALGGIFAKELAEAGIKAGVKGSVKAAGKQALKMEAGEIAVESVAKASAKRGLVGTTVDQGMNIGRISENSKGIGLGRLLRDNGTLSSIAEKGAQSVGNVAAGVATNLRVGIGNAGELYNTYAEMKNDDGEPMFTQEELAQMASTTVLNNSQYMLMDILSYGMTYAKGGLLESSMMKGIENTAKGYTKGVQKKIAGALTAKATYPAVEKMLTTIGKASGKVGDKLYKGKGLAKWAATGAMEGVEESIQEVHEEWSKMKAFQEETGSLVNYEGPGKEHAESFSDFYLSKEMESTRAIAGFLGAGAGGVFNLKKIVDNSAEEGHKMNTRAELFKGSLKRGTQDRENQQTQVREVIKEQIFQGKEAYTEMFIKENLAKGVIDEDTAAELIDIVEEALIDREKTNALNINGKKAYYTNLTNERNIVKKGEEAQEKYTNGLAEIEDQFSDLSPEEKATDKNYQKAKVKIEKQNENTLNSLRIIDEEIQNNKKNLLAGEPAGPIIINAGSYKGALFYYNAADNQNNDTDEEWEQKNPGKVRDLDDADPHVKKLQQRLARGKKLASDFAKKTYSNVKDAAGNLVPKAKEFYNKLSPKAKEAYDKLAPKAKEAYDKARNWATEQGGKLKQSIAQNQKPAVANPDADQSSDYTFITPAPELEIGSSDYTDLVGHAQNLQSAKEALITEFANVDPNDQNKKAVDEYNKRISDIDNAILKTLATLEDDTDNDTDNNNTGGVSADGETSDGDTESNVSKKQSATETTSPLKNGDIVSISENGNLNGKFYKDDDALIPLEDKGKPESEQTRYSIADLDSNNSEINVTPTDDNIADVSTTESANKFIDAKLAQKPASVDGKVDDTNYSEDDEKIWEKRQNKQNTKVQAKKKALVSQEQRRRNLAAQKESSRKAEKEEAAKKSATQRIEDKAIEATAKAMTKSKTFFGKIAHLIKKAIKNGLFAGGAHGEHLYYAKLIRDSQIFGHGYLMRENEINSSELWNGKERPNVMYVNTMLGTVPNATANTQAAFHPLMNTIYIRADRWQNDEDYHHEFLHFTYPYMSNTPELKTYLREARAKYPKLYEKIKNDYKDLIFVNAGEFHNSTNSFREANDKIEFLESLGYNNEEARNIVNELKNPVKLSRLKKIMGNVSDAYMQENLPYTEAPFEDQLEINEEFFVNTQEGPRSEKYNVYFEERDPQISKKKFWDKVGDRVNKVSKSVQSKEQDMLDNLEIKDYEAFTDVSSEIWKNFKEHYPPGSLNPEIKEKRNEILEEDFIADIQKQQALILQHQIDKDQRKADRRKARLENDEDVEVTEEEEIIDDTDVDLKLDTTVSEDVDESENEDGSTRGGDTVFNSERGYAEKSITGIINKLIREINLKISKATANRMFAEGSDFQFTPEDVFFDDVALDLEMFERSKDSPTLAMFIAELENSSTPEVQQLMGAFENAIEGRSKIDVLGAYYTMNRKKHQLKGVIATVDNSGTLQIEDAETSRMKSQRQNSLGKVRDRSKADANQIDKKLFENYVAALERIRLSTNPKQVDVSDIKTVLSYLGQGVNTDRIIRDNVLIFGGKEVSIYGALKGFAKKSIKGRYVYDKEFKNQYGSNYREFDPLKDNIKNDRIMRDVYGAVPRTTDFAFGPYSRDSRVKSGRVKASGNTMDLDLRKLINSVIVTDAKFKNAKSFRDAQGNLTSLRVGNNAMLTFFEDASNDLLSVLDSGKDFPLRSFVNKYTTISKNKGVGSFSNNMLIHMYNQIKKTGKPFMPLMSLGSQNFLNDTGKTLNQFTPEEDGIHDLMMFDKSKDSKSFFMDMGRFATSSRKYLINVPIDGEQTFNADYSLKDNALNRAAYNIYNNQVGKKISFGEYSQIMKEETQNEIAYWEEKRQNLLPEVRDAVSVLASSDKKVISPLSVEQKNDIAKYFHAVTTNGLFLNELILPDFSFDQNEFIKRGASASTTQVPLPNTVQNEVIYFHSGETNSKGKFTGDDTDGAAYILKEDFDRIHNMAGSFMPMNGHIKMAHVGVERNGPDQYNNQSQYDKPNYVVLTPAMVKQNPQLGPLLDLMERRKAKWTEQQKKKGLNISNNYIDGTENHIITAVSISAEKTKSEVKYNNSININEINYSDGTFLEEHNDTLDDIYYPKGKFKGMTGGNLGVQLVMNNNLTRTAMPSQALSFITGGGNLYGDLDEMTQVQQYMVNSMQENIAEFKDIANTNDPDQITSFLIEKGFFNEDKMSKIARMILLEEKKNMAIPQVRTLVLNTIKQYIIKNGNKLTTPGTQARVVPGFAYRKQFTVDGKSFEIEELNENGTPISGSSGIQHYKTTYQSIDGEIKRSYSPGEIVAPANLEKLGVRKRQYFTSWDGNNFESGKAYRKAVSAAINAGLKESDVKRFQLKGKTGDASYGFYVPGDVVMTTRIPSHGPQSTGFFEVIDFEASGTSQVQTSSKYSKITGQDFDGDALFINIKEDGNTEWNKAFDKMKDHWLSPEMQEGMVNQELTFEQSAQEAIDILEENQKNDKKRKMPTYAEDSINTYTPSGRRTQLRNTKISESNIGTVMSLHKTYATLSDHEVKLRQPIKFGNYNLTGFNNNPIIMLDENGNEVKVPKIIMSANIANMNLDDLKHGYAIKLGITPITIKYVMPLINMGVDLADIALIMNSDLMKQWVSLNENENNMYTSDEYIKKDILHKDNMHLLMGTVDPNARPSIDFDAIYDPTNEASINSTSSKLAIAKLISELANIQNEIIAMNTVTKGHTKMETNSFIINEQLEKFDNFLESKTKTMNGFSDNFLVIPESLKTSPLFVNYRNNLELMRDISVANDVAANTKGNSLWNVVVSKSPKIINQENQRALHSALEKFSIAQSMNLSGSDILQHAISLTEGPKKVKDPKTGIEKTVANPKNIFDRIGKYVAKTKLNESEKTGKSNALFDSTILTNLFGKNEFKYIRLNGVAVDEDVSAEMTQFAISQFAELPIELQRDLVIYDLMNNGFNSNNSLFPLFPSEIKNQIANSINGYLENSSLISPNDAHAKFAANFLGNNSEKYTLKTTNLIQNINGKIRINPKAKDINVSELRAIENTLKKGIPLYVTNVEKTNTIAREENKKLYLFKPLSPQQNQNYREIKEGGADISNFGLQPDGQFKNDQENYFNNVIESKITEVEFNSENAKEAQIFTTSENLAPRGPLFDNLNETEIKEKRTSTAETNYKYEEQMDRSNFDAVMDYPVNFEESRKQQLYEQYQNDYKDAEILNAQYSDERIDSMSDKEIMDLYSKESADPKEAGLGYKNKFAYAKIMNRVNNEIANRAALEQGNLIRQQNPNEEYKDSGKSKDLGVIQAWLMTSNIPSEHPALQAAVRRMKLEEKTFKEEKAKYMKRLNKVTGELYKEKLGYNPYEGLGNRLRYIASQAFNYNNKADGLKSLYGNLILEEQIEVDGKVVDNMRYHDHSFLKKQFDEGNLTQAEWNFYTETKAISDEFMPKVVKSGRGTREQYIPHVAPTMMEAYSRKGLLGVMVNLKTLDEQLGDVKMKYNDKMMRYAEIEVQMIKDYNAKNQGKKAVGKEEALKLFDLKNRATKLLNKGLNEDGTKIKYTDVQIGSTLGDVFMNEFSGARGVKASQMPSYDLNKAFGDYIHGALFNQGNDKFDGFKKMLPLIDGILARANKNNQPNTIKYVERVWRDYFLKGAKQHNLKSTSEMKALGVSTDAVIDFMTKGSLFYWLGYKGLLIKGGVYSIGNVIAGKYNNIKDRGGKEWVAGEKRFWRGGETFNPLNPFAGVKKSMAILKKAGFMDINLYDDVTLDKANTLGGFLGDVALLPMAWGEKWIQGVQFLGSLSQEEYDGLANNPNYSLDKSRLNSIESNITLSQGRGYQPTDQRMAQMYSYGRTMLQFSRWIPTTMNNLFAKRDYDINGQIHVGTYTAAYQHYGQLIQRFTSGELSPAQYKAYREKLTDSEKRRLDSAWRGFGLMSLAAVGSIMGFDMAGKVLNDANIFADTDGISRRFVPPAVSMTQNLVGL